MAAYNHRVSKAFNCFIVDAGLVEVPLINSLFTWFGPSNKKGKLDRALVTPTWFDKGGWKLQAHHRKLSDHRPIVLKSEVSEWGPIPFKFFNCWLQDPVLAQNLKLCWTSISDTNPQIIFRALREVARTWNKYQLGNVDSNIEQLEQKQTWILI